VRSACRRLLVLGHAMAALAAQDVQDVQWGFDGRAVPGRFNVVSVYVHNPSPTPFEGTVRLHRCQPYGARLDAPIEEPCHLSPGSGRWVQLHPFVAGTAETWEIVCGRTSRLLESVRSGPPSTVLLDGENAGAPLAGLPSFPAARFPAFAAATEALHAAVLDHVPAWDAARRAAFADWLRAGGRLHLLRPFGGELRFAGELAMLNDPSPRFRVGAGLVERHPQTRTQLGDAQRRGIGLRARSADEDMPQPLQTQLLERLRQGIAPRHQWGLIFLTAFVYLGLVGPLHWRLSRRWSARTTNVTLLATVAAFSWIFMSVGARGYDEQQQVTTLGYARDLGDGAWLATLYNDVFATSGDVYPIGHGAEHALYSGAQQHEAIRGVIRNGRQGRFAVDIPLFSNREFVCRGRFAHPSLRLVPEAWPAAGRDGLARFAARVDDAFPRDVVAIRLLHAGHMCPARRVGDRIVATGAVERLDDALDVAAWRDETRRYERLPGAAARFRPDSDVEQREPLEDIASSLFDPLLIERLGLLVDGALAGADEPDRIQVFVLAKAPAAFAVQCPGLDRNDGYVVFHTDLIEAR
jgi:hypothetical protein